MNKVLLVMVLVIVVGVFILASLMPTTYTVMNHPVKERLFEISAIDTMKYSRDLAKEKLRDLSFDAEIERQTKAVKETGATHIAIATPYDSQFLPFLRRWVATARQHGLSVWFRGNFSGWEGWFEYMRIGRDAHMVFLEEFILSNPDLFRDGDIFTPCPECENGGPGDPRSTRDVHGFRKFLSDEKKLADRSFKTIGKDVFVGFFSMNGDVAFLTMDKSTTRELGGLAVMDHYVKSLERMNDDIVSLAEQSGGKVVLGEYGAPIPDINGYMSEKDQADYVEDLLRVFYKNHKIIAGVNYWTLKGSSTAILRDDNSKKPVYEVLKRYYSAPYVTGVVTDGAGLPLQGVKVSISDTGHSVTTDRWGWYQIFLPTTADSLLLEGDGFASTSVAISREYPKEYRSIIEPIHPTLKYRIQQVLFEVRKKLGI